MKHIEANSICIFLLMKMTEYDCYLLMKLCDLQLELRNRGSLDFVPF